MADQKNNFTNSKMNKDLDERLIPPGEYRDARNIIILNTQQGSAGLVQNIKSTNKIPGPIDGVSNLKCIGFLVDNFKEQAYYFVTNFNTSIFNGEVADDSYYCGILRYDKKDNEIKELVRGSFLNFHTNYPIYGVNIVEDMLFWTDNLNQPRRINITRASNDVNYYKNEKQIALARCTPISAPLLLKSNGTSSMEEDASVVDEEKSKFMERKFLRFSYRYKFIDNEYSTIAPFSQHAFVPLKDGLLDQQDKVIAGTTGKNPLMRNKINKVGLKIELPSDYVYYNEEIKGIEILLKESDGLAVKVVEYIDLKTFRDNTLYFNYKSSNPYKVLPESQINRVSDIVPVKALAQESVGNRIILGNFEQGYDLPELRYSLFHSPKSDFNIEYPLHSVKQGRTYEAGIILVDSFGRESSVIPSKTNKTSSVFVRYIDDGTSTFSGRQLNVLFQSEIPNAIVTKNLEGTITTGSGVYSEYVSGSGKKKIIIYGVDLATQQGLFIISPGSYLKSGYTEITKITNVEYDSQAGDTTITCDGSISDIYIKDNTPGTISMFVYNKNPLGYWKYYKVVIKQKQTDFYNVYCPSAGWYNDKSYITLLGDNVNKVPSDFKAEVGVTGSFSVKTRPSEVILFPKVLPIYTTNPSIAFQYKAKQASASTPSIQVLSIGLISDFSFPSTGSGSVYERVAFESYKTPLLAEVLDVANPSSDAIYGVDRTTPGTQLNYSLSVFETNPFESKLDIFWETSTYGLVEDLNYEMIQSGDTPHSLILSSNGLIPENTTPNSFVDGELIAVPGAALITNYEIVKAVDYFNPLIDRTNMFTVEQSVPGTWKIKVLSDFVYNSSSVEDLSKQKFKITVKITDADGNVSEGDVNVSISNVVPFVIQGIPNLSYTNTFETSPVIGTMIFSNGSSRTQNNENRNGLVYSLSMTRTINGNTTPVVPPIFKIVPSQNNSIDIVFDSSTGPSQPGTYDVTVTANDCGSALDPASLSVNSSFVVEYQVFSGNGRDLWYLDVAPNGMTCANVYAPTGGQQTAYFVSGNILTNGMIAYESTVGNTTITVNGTPPVYYILYKASYDGPQPQPVYLAYIDANGVLSSVLTCSSEISNE